MKRNEEKVTVRFKTKPIDPRSFCESLEIQDTLNIDILPNGNLSRRKGYNTFGEMVHVLWDINKRYRRQGFAGDFSVRLPLKGTKPVYKKTLKKV